MNGNNNERISIALALSGGGFRATLFHLGSLQRLNESGILKKVECISCVSGGSIIGNYLGLHWSDLKFDSGGIATNFEQLIIDPVRKFCSLNIDVIPSIMNMAAMLVGGVTRGLMGAYEKLYGSSTLQDLPDMEFGPDVITLGSNLQTGARVYFSRNRLHEERLGYIESPDIPIAMVVAISSGFPPFLSPVILKTDPDKWKKDDSSDLFGEISLRKRMVLTDGGIHDPAAVGPLIEKYSTILVSDGSSTKEVWRKPSSFWIRQLDRTTLMQTVSNSEAYRKALEHSSKNVVWWCNADRIDSYGINDPLLIDSKMTMSLGSMRTRLNRFTGSEQEMLINWGYSLCDAALKRNGRVIDAGVVGKASLPYAGML
jgi:NTE family protein